MKYDRFEDLPVWQKAAELSRRVYALTRHAEFRPHPGLRDQIERAGLSVSNNIAEGFERGTTPELIAFLYISRGSSGELRSAMLVIERVDEFSGLVKDIVEIAEIAENCSRQLHGWLGHLQDTDIKGPRHLNTRTREQDQRRKEREEFIQQLARIRADADARRASGAPPPPGT